MVTIILSFSFPFPLYRPDSSRFQLGIGNCKKKLKRKIENRSLSFLLLAHWSWASILPFKSASNWNQLMYVAWFAHWVSRFAWPHTYSQETRAVEDPMRECTAGQWIPERFGKSQLTWGNLFFSLTFKRPNKNDSTDHTADSERDRGQNWGWGRKVKEKKAAQAYGHRRWAFNVEIRTQMVQFGLFPHKVSQPWWKRGSSETQRQAPVTHLLLSR